MQLLKNRKEKYKEIFSAIDGEMSSAYFITNYNNDICNYLTNKWIKDCKRQEDISEYKFSNKEEFFLNNTSRDFQETGSEISKLPQQNKRNINNNFCNN